MPARKTTYVVKKGVVLYMEGVPYGEAEAVELEAADGERYLAEDLVEAVQS